MKRIIHMITAFVALTCVVFSCLGCGHGQNFTLLTGEISEESDGIVTPDEPLTPGQHAKAVVEGMTRDLLYTSTDIIKSMGFTASVPIVTSSVSTKNSSTMKATTSDGPVFTDVLIQRSDSKGQPMSAAGAVALTRRGSYHCAIFALLDLDYDSYRLSSRATLTGWGKARLIISSCVCKFYENIHVDIRVNGDFVAHDQTFEELISQIDYNYDTGTNLSIKSSEIQSDEDILYCFDYNDNTECLSVDLREPMQYCSLESDVCEVTNAGHEDCMRDKFGETGAHCNLGCCDALPAEYNVCNGSPYAQRDCNPAHDALYSSTYLLWGETLMTYEVPLRCSDDGLWTPPCPLDGSFDICPFGGVCVPPDDEGWGQGLEHYGYCSCILPPEQPLH